ncbi:uncharacterized protein LOC119588168 [Penaeus monodon]|uniref:uncharacterized protein LOC119588168 n=1 Tax=Penaeus monodon TaxID=6687 RepID=UPI0018A71A4D|nr:uncharacterized protein LOC119588168 [Penaeus monodon]
MLNLLLTWLMGVSVTLVAGWLSWWFLLRPTPIPPTATHPYARPSVFYPLKVLVFYCLVKFRKRTAGSPGDAGYGAKSHDRVELMERPQPLAPAPKAIDAVFFSGHASDGWGVILAMERRPSRLTSTLVYLKVPGVGLLVAPAHPDTIAFRGAAAEERFEAGGVAIEPEAPMKTWRLRFSGKLRRYDQPEGELFDVKLELLWSSDLPHFDYDSDMDVLTTAKAFALETWTRSTSTACPSGKLREWRLMHRYVFHHIFLDDGSMGVVGVVCQPSTCSRLVLGHWWSRVGEGAPVTCVDLQLHEHGEGGTPPKDYAFAFTAGGEERVVEVTVEESPEHFLGWDWEARMVETWVKYCVNGSPGKGICEWNYQHLGGRPKALTDGDPEWTRPYRTKYLAA